MAKSTGRKSDTSVPLGLEAKHADRPGFCKAAKLDAAITANLKELGHGG